MATPESQGFSTARLERIEPMIRAALDEGIMVGGQTLIARNGHIVHNETWGLRDREASAPMQDDTLYRIYSMTKPIAGVALLMLYEEGKFLLKDPIAKYLPELADLKVAVAKGLHQAYL